LDWSEKGAMLCSFMEQNPREFASKTSTRSPGRRPGFEGQLQFETKEDRFDEEEHAHDQCENEKYQREEYQGRKNAPEDYRRERQKGRSLMKFLLLFAFVGCVFSFVLPIFAQQPNTPDPQLRRQLLALAKKFEEAWNNNDAAALAALFTKDAILVEQAGPVHGREAIERHYTDLFQNVHFSNNLITYNDPDSPHIIGTDGNETWENGEWRMTYQVKGGHASIAVREGGVWKKRMLISNITLAPAVTSSSRGNPGKQ
jgi:ketosteroid isomerase-like protein